jgi:hypothetical protein
MVLKDIGARRAADPATTESTLLAMSNRALDGLFRASPAGPVPDGNMRGTLVAFSGTPLARPVARLARLVGWQGKVVSRRRGVLVNKVSPLRLRAIRALVGLDDSWVDGSPCVLIDYSRTSFVARKVRDEIRLVGPQLYLGVIWLGHRRIGWFTLREPVAKAGRRR